MTAKLQSSRADRIEKRWAEIDRFRNRRDSEAILRLLSLLDDPSWDVRERALNVLWESAVLPHARLAARALLQDQSPGVRSTAAEALGEVGKASDVSRLITALNDSEWIVRASAAGSLGRFRTARALKGLETALTDFDPAVRRYAAVGLSLRHDPSVIPMLEAALDREHDNAALTGILSALYVLGQRHRLGHLLSLLDNEDAEIPCQVLDGLIGDLHADDRQVVASTLHRMLSHELHAAVRERSEKALALLEGAKAVQMLRQ